MELINSHNDNFGLIKFILNIVVHHDNFFDLIIIDLSLISTYAFFTKVPIIIINYIFITACILEKKQ